MPGVSSPTAQRVAALRDESFEVAEQLVSALPKDPHAWSLLATVHHRFGNEAEAMRLWKECLRLNPRFADAYHSFGQSALKRLEFAAAEEHFRKALEIDPQWAEVPLPLATALASQGKFRDAADVLELFLTANPNSAEGWFRLGSAQHQLGEYENARQSHLKAHAINPANPDAAYGIALALQKSDQPGQAQEFFDKFAELRAQEQQAIRQERVTFDDEDVVRTAVVNTRMTASLVCQMRGLSREAEAHSKRVAELDPVHCESRENLCSLYASQQRLTEAIQVRQELCRLEPDNPRQWHGLGVLLSKARQLTEAAAAFRRVIELAPHQAEGYAALAQVQMFPGRDQKEAVALARTAVELAPTAAHHHIFATACWNAGDPASSLVALEQALRLDPANDRYRDDYIRVQQSFQPLQP